MNNQQALLKNTNKLGTNTQEVPSGEKQQNYPKLMSMSNFDWAIKFFKINLRPGITLKRRGENNRQPQGGGR